MNDWRYFSHKKTRRSDWSGSFVWEIQIGKKKKEEKEREHISVRATATYI